MRRFTKEELDALKAAEQYFNTAVNSDYKRATTLKMDKMVADIYEKAGGKPSRSFACSVCSYKLYKAVGAKYYEDLDEYNKQVVNELEPTKEITDNNEEKATDKDGITETKGSTKESKGKQTGKKG